MCVFVARCDAVIVVPALSTSTPVRRWTQGPLKHHTPSLTARMPQGPIEDNWKTPQDSLKDLRRISLGLSEDPVGPIEFAPLKHVFICTCRCVDVGELLS